MTGSCTKDVPGVKGRNFLDLPVELQDDVFSLLVPAVDIAMRIDPAKCPYDDSNTIVSVINHEEWHAFIALLRLSKSLGAQVTKAFERECKAKRAGIKIDVRDANIVRDVGDAVGRPGDLQPCELVCPISDKWLALFETIEVICPYQMGLHDQPAFIQQPGPVRHPGYNHKLLTMTVDVTIDKLGLSPSGMASLKLTSAIWTAISQMPATYAIDMQLAEGFDDIRAVLEQDFKEIHHGETVTSKRMLRSVVFVTGCAAFAPMGNDVGSDFLDEALAQHKVELARQVERNQWSARLA